MSVETSKRNISNVIKQNHGHLFVKGRVNIVDNFSKNNSGVACTSPSIFSGITFRNIYFYHAIIHAFPNLLMNVSNPNDYHNVSSMQ